MPSGYEILRDALRARLETLSPKPPIYYEDETVTPVDVETLHLRVNLIPAQQQQPQLGIDGQNLELGVFQIMICTPLGEGHAKGDFLIAPIIALFKRGTIISGIRTMAAWVAPGLVVTEGTWWGLPISVSYYVYQAN